MWTVKNITEIIRNTHIEINVERGDNNNNICIIGRYFVIKYHLRQSCILHSFWLKTKGSINCISPVTLAADRQWSERAEEAKTSRRRGSINTENKGFAPPILIQYGCETCFGVQTYNQDENHVSIQQKCFRRFLSASKQVKSQVHFVSLKYSVRHACNFGLRDPTLLSFILD